MANIDRAFIDQVLSSTNIVDLIKEKVNLTKNGSNYKGLCPFHNEKTPSFNVSATKQFYHCFGCGASGDAIKFLMEHDHLTFIEALSKLSQYANIEFPENTKKNDDSYNLFIINKKASKFFRESLLSNTKALDYLSDRNINKEMIEEFNIGLSNNSWDDLSKLFAKSNETKNGLEAGLLIDSNNKIYDRFRNRIMFPIRNTSGNYIGFGGRIYNSDESAKYINSPETKLFHKSYELYGFYESKKFINKENQALVVEGYTDVIGLHNAGIKNCIATLGTAFTKYHFKKIIRYTKNIVFCFDGDTAGKSAAWKAINNCLSELKDDIQLYFIFLPEGKDPDSYVQNEKDSFLSLIANAMPLSKYLIDSLKFKINLDTVEGRTSFSLKAKEILNQMPKITYTDILKKEFEKISGNTIRLNNQENTIKNKPKNSISENEDFDIKELTLLNLLLEYPSLIEEGSYEKYIRDVFLKEIYCMLKKESDNNNNFQASMLINMYPDNEKVEKIINMESNELSEDSARVTVNTIINQLERKFNEVEYFELLNRYSRGDKLTDIEREFIKNFKK
tara:strand:+ start:3498 stop:5183 length:1686 start_codon:yes stop_codon:yes gene_type:complete